MPSKGSRQTGQNNIKLSIKSLYCHYPSIPSCITLTCNSDSHLAAGGEVESLTAERKRFRMVSQTLEKKKKEFHQIALAFNKDGYCHS